MSEHVWAKVYLELPSDPKLIGRSAHDCYLWVCLILIAKASDGVIPPWQAQAKYLSKYARVPLKETVAALCYFEDVGMVEPADGGGFILPHFDRRQRRKESDTPDRTAARKRMSRAGHANVTPSHAIRTREEAEGRGLTSPSPKEAEAEQSANADLRIPEIFGKYQRLIQPQARLIDAARDKIRTRLKTFTVEELCDAVQHFANDSWEMEHNAHRGAAWFFDSDKRIEQYVNLTQRDYRPMKVVY